MQLDATLRSFYLHCQDSESITLFVIYRTTTKQHFRQYNQLITEYKNFDIKFIKETNFRNNIMNLLIERAYGKSNSWSNFFTKLVSTFPIFFILPPPKKQQFLLFLVDDCIFVRKFSLLQKIDDLKNQSTALGYSLRLGTNTSYCYTLQSLQRIPNFTSISEETNLFCWKKADLDFAYPLEVSSSIYRFKDLYPFILKFTFNNPNSLESKISCHAKHFAKTKPNLLCSNLSIAFSNPINKIQEVFPNRVGSSSKYSINNLAELFDKGQRININSFAGYIPKSCHEEIELEFLKNEM